MPDLFEDEEDTVCGMCGGDRYVFEDVYSPARGHHTIESACPNCSIDDDETGEYVRFDELLEPEIPCRAPPRG